MAQRDYLLRLIEQLGQLLRRAIFQREKNSPQEALQTIMASFERLFGMEAVEIFRFTPDQHVLMLAEGETAENARQKILMYAALNAEAALCYRALLQPNLANQATLNALRLTLKTRRDYSSDAWPDFAPKVDDLLRELGDTPLDFETAELLAASRINDSSGAP